MLHATPDIHNQADLETDAVGPLSLSTGAPLIIDRDRPVTLSAALIATAKKFPNRGITYLNTDGLTTTQSYSSLYQRALKLLGVLQSQGLQPQDKVILQFAGNQDFIEGFWACILGGFVPVPLEIASPDDANSDAAKALYHAWNIFQQPLILTNKAQVNSLVSLANQWQQPNYQIVAIEDLRSTHREDAGAPPTCHQGNPKDLTLLFLNGRFGKVPKGVQLSHRNIISNIAANVQQGWLNSDDIYLNWLPLCNPGPLLRSVIWTTYLGSQQVQGAVSTVMDNPLKWLDWIDRYRVTITWSPNFALKLLNDQANAIASGHWDLSSIRYWLNTAEPIVPKTGQTFLKLMTPHGLSADSLHGVWGMKETAASATDSNRYASDAQIEKDEILADLGLPLPGVALRIVNDQQILAPEQTIGHLQVKGDVVTCGYYQSPDLNKEVFTSDGWYKTGDLGFLSEGRLTLTGRSKSLIIVNGKNHYSHEIEQAVEDLSDGITPVPTAACGVRQPGSDTDSIVIFLDTTDYDKSQLPALLQAIEKNVALKIGVRPTYFVPLETDAILKTKTDDIDRRQLQQLFEAGKFKEITQQAAQQLAAAKYRSRDNIYAAPQNETEAALVHIWQDLLGDQQIGRHDNFFELGGQSLLATQVISQIRERFSVELPLRSLFGAPTVISLAESIQTLKWIKQDEPLSHETIEEEREAFDC